MVSLNGRHKGCVKAPLYFHPRPPAQNRRVGSPAILLSRRCIRNIERNLPTGREPRIIRSFRWVIKPPFRSSSIQHIRCVIKVFPEVARQIADMKVETAEESQVISPAIMA